MAMKQLKEFDQNFGWILRWLLMLVLFGIVFIADGRYLTIESAEEKETHYLSMREHDLNKIYNRIDALATAHSVDYSKIEDIQSRLSRIEAQNEIILRYVERQQNRAFDP
jgi:hypothetical protein